jgi:hypothetical protein
VRLVPHTDCPAARIPPGAARIVTILVANPDFGDVEVRVAGRALSVHPYAPTASLTLPAGPTHIAIGAVGTPETFASSSPTLDPGNAYIVVWAGGGERAAGALRILRDSAQSPVAPPSAHRQPINTGMGERLVPTRLPLGLLVVGICSWLVACSSSRSRLLALSLLLSVGTAGCSDWQEGRHISPSVAPSSTAPVAPVRPASATAETGLLAPAVGAAPVRLRIRRIHLDRTVSRMGMNKLAGLPRSLSLDEVAWLAGTSIPGRPGTMALLGHSNFSDEGAFSQLGSVAPGDLVHVTDASHRTHVYVVKAVRSFPKAELPDQLWSPQPDPTLAMITCSGPMDPSTGLHANNLLVWAVAQRA